LRHHRPLDLQQATVRGWAAQDQFGSSVKKGEILHDQKIEFMLQVEEVGNDQSSNLKPARAVKNCKRVAAARSGTASRCRGNGQKSCSASDVRGGQINGAPPLKRGFTNIFKKELTSSTWAPERGLDEVKIQDYFDKNLPASAAAIKVLADGKFSRKMKIQAHQFSRAALEKIQKAGGEAIVFKEMEIDQIHQKYFRHPTAQGSYLLLLAVYRMGS
jgi:large subunit ribosomal protein L15